MSKKIYDKITDLIFEKPSYRFHLREMARLANAHPNSVKAVSVKLEKEGIVKVEKKTHITEIYADLESKIFIRRKRAFNFEQIYSSGIIEYLSEQFDPESISAIGSYSRGEDIEKSDIDLIIIDASKKPKEVNTEKFEKMLKRNVHITITGYKEMSDEFYINLINGMLLYGHITGKK